MQDFQHMCGFVALWGTEYPKTVAQPVFPLPSWQASFNAAHVRGRQGGKERSLDSEFKK